MSHIICQISENVNSNERFTEDGRLNDADSQRQSVACQIYLQSSTETFTTPGDCTCFGQASCDTCDAGYEPNDVGNECEDINECESNNGGCDVNATCTDTVGSFTCACNDGFTGHGTACSNDNECTDDSHNCDPNATCTDTVGSFTCACND